MSRTNKILLTVLSVLLLLMVGIWGFIAAKSGLFSSTLAQPYNETRYSGTIEGAEGLADGPVDVVLVVRFHDGGQRGELTSPTLLRYSELERVDKHVYRETVVHGEGEASTWTFDPSDGAMNISYETPDGASGSATLPETAPEDTAGEVGINPTAPGVEPDGIEFDEQAFRNVGTVRLQDGPWEDHHRVDDGALPYYELDKVDEETDIILRLDTENRVWTVTYPERQCYGYIDTSVGTEWQETITVGDCESGGIWSFYRGDVSTGSAQFTSADGTRIGHLDFHHSDWDDITGEIGLARSGPVLEFYEQFGATGNSDDSVEAGSCDAAAFDAVVDDWPGALPTEVMYCDGEWAYAGMGGSDYVARFQFADGEWNVLVPDSESTIERRPCYTEEYWRELGAPAEFVDEYGGLCTN